MPRVLKFGRYICWTLRSYRSVYPFLIGLSLEQPKERVKLHTVLDYDTGLPCYAVLTEAKKHDVKSC